MIVNTSEANVTIVKNGNPVPSIICNCCRHFVGTVVPDDENLRELEIDEPVPPRLERVGE